MPVSFTATNGSCEAIAQFTCWSDARPATKEERQLFVSAMKTAKLAKETQTYRGTIGNIFKNARRFTQNSQAANIYPGTLASDLNPSLALDELRIGGLDLDHNGREEMYYLNEATGQLMREEQTACDDLPFNTFGEISDDCPKIRTEIEEITVAEHK